MLIFKTVWVVSKDGKGFSDELLQIETSKMYYLDRPTKRRYEKCSGKDYIGETGLRMLFDDYEKALQIYNKLNRE